MVNVQVDLGLCGNVFFLKTQIMSVRNNHRKIFPNLSSVILTPELYITDCHNTFIITVSGKHKRNIFDLIVFPSIF